MNFTTPHRASSCTRPRTRAELLAHRFLSCLDLIELHQEQALPPGYLSDYQALGWIEKKDGGPQITPAGMEAVRDLQARQRKD